MLYLKRIEIEQNLQSSLSNEINFQPFKSAVTIDPKR